MGGTSESLCAGMFQQSDVVTVSPLVAWHPQSDDKTPGSQANCVTFGQTSCFPQFPVLC